MGDQSPFGAGVAAVCWARATSKEINPKTKAERLNLRIIRTFQAFEVKKKLRGCKVINAGL
jgi:hypothetical protein